MMATRPDVAQKIKALMRADDDKRAELLRRGELGQGYHPEMQAVHDANAEELKRLIKDLGGWPTEEMVGKEAVEDAWRIVQHAIGHPDFQREGLKLLQTAAASGHAPAWQAAYLEDRICIFEGRPQIYGTQFDWNEDGQLAPQEIADPSRVDMRRAAAGLPPLAEASKKMRDRAAAEGQVPPKDPEKRKQEFTLWAKKTGWRP
jgi:hypothetical protein